MHLVLIETSGNQAFIFATNKLGENVGASELTYRAGTRLVLEAVGKKTQRQLWPDNGSPAKLRENLLNPSLNKTISNGSNIEVVMATSGKALLLAQEKKDAQDIVSDVTREALVQAPGLDIMGVVSAPFAWVPNGTDLQKHIRAVHEEFEELRSIRPGPATRFPMLPVAAQCSSSGRPSWVLEKEGDSWVVLSRESKVKRDSAAHWHGRIGEVLSSTPYKTLDNPDQLERLYRELNWLAVVHADGNGLGKIFLEFDQHLSKKDNATHVHTLRSFSVALEEATEAAFKRALVQLPALKKVGKGKQKNLLPIIPLVLGGDDLTAICDGEFALPFAVEYLRAFEDETGNEEHCEGVIPQIAKKALGCARLSACAGVAIIKPHFPFHKAYELSEQLLRSAKSVKKHVTHLHQSKVTSYPCSGLDFHILYDSTFTELEAIRDQLKVNDTSLTSKPYIVTDISDGVADGTWARQHHYKGLELMIAAIRATDEDGRRKLPNSQLHDLREGLFLGREGADGRMKLIRARYAKEGLNDLLEKTDDDPSLFRAIADGSGYETRFLDALEAAHFWGDTKTSQQGDDA